MTQRILLKRITKMLKTRSLPIWQIAAETGARPQDVMSICITMDVRGVLKQVGDEWTVNHNAPKTDGGYSVFSMGVVA
jgi:predicted Rossmann fold nucleotide-binding protein DprA/Smf involved in DNA uptake